MRLDPTCQSPPHAPHPTLCHWHQRITRMRSRLQTGIERPRQDAARRRMQPELAASLSAAALISKVCYAVVKQLW